MSQSTSAAANVAATCHSGPTAAPRGRTTALEDFTRGIWRENPVLVQMMGLCPTLAVTNTLVNGVAMALATTFVLLASSIMVSALRNFIAYEVLTLALVLMASIRENVEPAPVPRIARGMALKLIIAGILSIAFMGFAGLISGT